MIVKIKHDRGKAAFFKIHAAVLFLLCLGLAFGTAGCKSTSPSALETADYDEGIRTVGLILTASDAEENESVIAAFETLAGESGANLIVYVPDVTASEAAEALMLEPGTFAVYDVNPIEYQMRAVDEIVAEDADLIVIHPNHASMTASVLEAARAVGITVYVWGVEVPEGCFDVYEDNFEAIYEAAAAFLNDD